MGPQPNNAEPSFAEFVIIISLMMSLTALSTDTMLPALAQIGADLGVQDANNRQMVVGILFLGSAVGQLFFGPLSDSIGRKPVVYAGYGLYIAGALVSAYGPRISRSFSQSPCGKTLTDAQGRFRITAIGKEPWRF